MLFSCNFLDTSFKNIDNSIGSSYVISNVFINAVEPSISKIILCLFVRLLNDIIFKL